MGAGKSCENCKWCVLADWGYSNYTVEGTSVHCLKKLHPDDGFDRWYGEDKRLAFANECSGYEKGDATHIDVDREDWNRSKPLSSAYADDPEVGKLLDEWNAAR